MCHPELVSTYIHTYIQTQNHSQHTDPYDMKLETWWTHLIIEYITFRCSNLFYSLSCHFTIFHRIFNRLPFVVTYSTCNIGSSTNISIKSHFDWVYVKNLPMILLFFFRFIFFPWECEKISLEIHFIQLQHSRMKYRNSFRVYRV